MRVQINGLELREYQLDHSRGVAVRAKEHRLDVELLQDLHGLRAPVIGSIIHEEDGLLPPVLVPRVQLGGQVVEVDRHHRGVRVGLGERHE